MIIMVMTAALFPAPPATRPIIAIYTYLAWGEHSLYINAAPGLTSLFFKSSECRFRTRSTRCAFTHFNNRTPTVAVRRL